MLDIIIKDILPIFVIMFLGFAAGKSKVFTYDNAQIFNKLVLTYALPAALFVSIVKADREMLFADLKLTAISFIIITTVFLWSYFSCHKFFGHTKSEAAVCALISGSPTIGFLGFAVLEPIYGATPGTGLVVAIISIVVNAINIPIGLALMNAGEINSSNKTSQPINHKTGITKNSPILNALSQPVCWAPISAVILVLSGIKFPSIFDPNFELIANANAGVAVFAAGLTLSAMKIQINSEIIYNTFVKLIIMPAMLLLIGWLFDMKAENLQMMVLAGALPPAFSGIIIGSRYQFYVQTGTSSLAFSILAFIITAPFWIWLSRTVAT